jgi:hypothetical protein
MIVGRIRDNNIFNLLKRYYKGLEGTDEQCQNDYLKKDFFDMDLLQFQVRLLLSRSRATCTRRQSLASSGMAAAQLTAQEFGRPSHRIYVRMIGSAFVCRCSWVVNRRHFHGGSLNFLKPRNRSKMKRRQRVLRPHRRSCGPSAFWRYNVHGVSTAQAMSHSAPPCCAVPCRL